MMARLELIQVISLKGWGGHIPRSKWLALCESFELRRPRHPDTWHRFDGPSFAIRASDVTVEDRGSVPPAWGIRLEATGTLDAAGLKLWVELCLAGLTLLQKAGLRDIETSVFSPGVIR